MKPVEAESLELSDKYSEENIDEENKNLELEL
jgi:hypothetical protein